MKLPGGAPVSEPREQKRTQSGYGHNTPTDQAKHAYSTRHAKEKARRLTAEFTAMHVIYKAALRQALPEATDLGPSTANCIRSALDAQEALVGAVMADFRN